jgi:hypothetical protein
MVTRTPTRRRWTRPGSSAAPWPSPSASRRFGTWPDPPSGSSSASRPGQGRVPPQAHRRVAIPIIIEELLKGGAKLENITLLCAMGLHRKNTVEEWSVYLGKEIVEQFWPDRLVNHDAEAPDLRNFGKDEMGNVVQCNRLIAEADLPIVIGHCAGNPYGGYSGGYKMVVTGLVGWRSTASHHNPDTMHRDDWLGASTKQYMRRQFASIGRAIEAGMGKKFFAVDAVVGQKSQILDVQAGEIPWWSKPPGPWPTRGQTSIWTWASRAMSWSSASRGTFTTVRNGD